MTLFEDVVETLVDERLRLKTFGSDTLILDPDEKLDCLMIVLDGHINVQNQETGETLCQYQPE